MLFEPDTFFENYFCYSWNKWSSVNIEKKKKNTNIDVQIWCGRIHTEMFRWCM